MQFGQESQCQAAAGISTFWCTPLALDTALLPDCFLLKHIVSCSSLCILHSILILVWGLSSAFLHICVHCTHTMEEAVPSEFCEIPGYLPETIKCTFIMRFYHIFQDCFQDLICLLLSPMTCFLVYLFKFWKYALIKILLFPRTCPNCRECLHFSFQNVTYFHHSPFQ